MKEQYFCPAKQFLYLINVKNGKHLFFSNRTFHQDFFLLLSFLSTCENGCVECKPVPCVGQCTFGDWSDFGECSAPCNGTQSRYQKLQGPHCTRNDTNIETRPCSSEPTTYQKGCSTCTCLNTTKEQCVTNCAITDEICAQIEDPLFTYTYSPPTDGSCCGECVKVPSKYFLFPIEYFHHSFFVIFS